jgi:hypothetical protein
MAKKDDLMKFMMEKLGGEKEVHREFAKHRLMQGIGISTA